MIKDKTEWSLTLEATRESNPCVSPNLEFKVIPRCTVSTRRVWSIWRVCDSASKRKTENLRCFPYTTVAYLLHIGVRTPFTKVVKYGTKLG